MVQKGVDVSHAGPVPAGCTGQHLGQAFGVVLLTLEPVVPQDLVICPLQPEAKTGRDEVCTLSAAHFINDWTTGSRAVIKHEDKVLYQLPIVFLYLWPSASGVDGTWYTLKHRTCYRKKKTYDPCYGGDRPGGGKGTRAEVSCPQKLEKWMDGTESRWLEPSQREFCAKELVETHGYWQSRGDLAGSGHKRAFSWSWSSWKRADNTQGFMGKCDWQSR